MSSNFVISHQPTGTTCGPTALHSVYASYGDTVLLDDVVKSVTTLQSGGTIDAFLGVDALQRGYNATILTTNLYVFDPTWATLDYGTLAEKLTHAYYLAEHDENRRDVIAGYIKFLQLGGRITICRSMPVAVFMRLEHFFPVICGVSYTALFNCERYDDPTDTSDEFGTSLGHFIVVHNYDSKQQKVTVADPWDGDCGQHYNISVDELNRALLYGTLTNDGGMLIVRPK